MLVVHNTERMMQNTSAVAGHCLCRILNEKKEYLAETLFNKEGEINMDGNILKALRNIYGISTVEMSKRLGISRSYLSEIENGNRDITTNLLSKYGQVFGVKPSYLMILDESFKDGKRSKAELFVRDLMVKAIMDLANQAD